ncbi:MAG TPA: hypothetical protein ENI51_06000, partial [Candidatus Atribacteria bacterium]|nr:hypothetical protein [Candidatus Atribacteria bacterium]
MYLFEESEKRKALKKLTLPELREFAKKNKIDTKVGGFFTERREMRKDELIDELEYLSLRKILNFVNKKKGGKTIKKAAKRKTVKSASKRPRGRPAAKVATKKEAGRKRTATKPSAKKTTKTSKLEKDFKEIVKFLKSKDVSFRYYEKKKERDYEDDLVNMLKFGLKKHNTIYQKIHGRGKIDILINDVIGVELKLHKGGKTVAARLQNQFSEYFNNPCKKMLALVINA